MLRTLQFRRGWLALTLIFIVLLSGGISPAYGQDDGTPTPTGTLIVHSYRCILDGAEPGSVVLQASGGLDGLTCDDGDPVGLAIDGTPSTFANGDSTALAVGEHTISEPAGGAQLVISIAESETTEIDAITVESPPATETPTDVPTNTATATAVPTASPIPVKNQITIVMHLCPATITSRASFESIVGFGNQLITCPSIVMPENNPAPGGLTNGRTDFSLTVEGANLGAQLLAPGMFDQRLFCEADGPRDLNGNPNDNVCLDLSAYVVPNVAQGNPVTIRPTNLPAGTMYVGRAFDPESNDDATFLSAGSTGTLKLNTSADGDVTVHYFVAPQPPTKTPIPPTSTPIPPTNTPKPPTATLRPATQTPKPNATATTRPPTSTPVDPSATIPAATSSPVVVPTFTPGGASGSLHAFMRLCFTDLDSWGEMRSLAPGQEPAQPDYGDGTCTYGAGTLVLTGPDGSTRQIDIPSIGNIRVSNLTIGDYSIRDTVSGGTGTFTIAANTGTNVLSLYYQSDALVDDPVFVPGPGDVDDPTEEANSPDDPNYTPVDEDDVPYFGTEAGPGGGNPFVVDDDPEAVANVAAIAAYDDLPGVGTGPAVKDDSGPGIGLIALALIAMGLAIGGLFLRRRQDKDDG